MLANGINKKRMTKEYDSLLNVVVSKAKCEPNYYPIGKSRLEYYCTKCGKPPSEH